MGAIKFLGYVQAGFPSPASDYMEERIDLNKELIRRPSSTYFFRAQNDSMIDANIPPNAILIVDKSIKAKNNSIVIAEVDGEFTVKFFVQNADGCMLLPANKKYKPIIITEGVDFNIWGVVTAVIIQTIKNKV